MTDLVTEYIKLVMGNPNTTDDESILFKYRFVVAFARKKWKLQPSIGRYVQIRPISEVRLAINTDKQPTHTPHTKLCTVCVCGNRKTTCIHQTVYWIIHAYIYIYLYIYIVDSNYYLRKSSINVRGLLGYGRQCMCRGLHFCGKIHYSLRTWSFIHPNTKLSVKRVELISERISHIMMSVCRWERALIVLPPTVNTNDDSKYNFYEELEQVFDHFPTYNMQILLGFCKAKFGTDDRFKPTTGKDHIVWIHQTLEKKQECKGTVH